MSELTPEMIAEDKALYERSQMEGKRGFSAFCQVPSRLPVYVAEVESLRKRVEELSIIRAKEDKIVTAIIAHRALLETEAKTRVACGATLVWNTQVNPAIDDYLALTPKGATTCESLQPSGSDGVIGQSGGNNTSSAHTTNSVEQPASNAGESSAGEEVCDSCYHHRSNHHIGDKCCLFLDCPCTHFTPSKGL